MTRRTPYPGVTRPPAPFVSRVLLLIGLVAAIATVTVLAWPRPSRAETIEIALRGTCQQRMHALAQEHADDMARRASGRCRLSNLDHDGFFSRRGPAGAIAENVACGYKTEAQTIAQWWRSPGHAANMRLPGCRGVAHAVSRSGVWYWSMEISR